MIRTITHKNNEPLWGDVPLVNHVSRSTFSAMVFEMFSGKTPNVTEAELFELLLKLSIDHGPNTPSAKITIASAKNGTAMGKAVGDGIHEVNEAHGGAGEPAMCLLYDIAEGKTNAEQSVKDFLAQKKRLPGFGHRLYKKDPRAEFIMKTIIRLGFPEKYVDIAREVGNKLTTHLSNKTLPLNIDGAIAVALCTLGQKPEMSTALFITARSGGLCAHYLHTVQGSAE